MEVTGVLIESRLFSRRGVLRGILRFGASAAAAGSATRLFAASDFWNKKDPQDWTSDEIDRLTTNSPWAKPVSAQVQPDQNGNGTYDPNNPNNYPQGGGGGPYGGQPRVGLGIPGLGIPGIGGGGYPGGRRGGQGRGTYQVRGTILWESADPVMAALKPQFPDEFKDHHVIAMSGFPFPPANFNGSEEDALADLKTVTYLRPERGDSLQPGVVQRPISSSVNGSILFGFSKDLLKVSADDKELQFSTRLGRSPIQAKFVPKDMLYRGKLAV
jgi:hypothetical protein